MPIKKVLKKMVKAVSKARPKAKAQPKAEPKAVAKPKAKAKSKSKKKKKKAVPMLCDGKSKCTSKLVEGMKAYLVTYDSGMTEYISLEDYPNRVTRL